MQARVFRLGGAGSTDIFSMRTVALKAAGTQSDGRAGNRGRRATRAKTLLVRPEQLRRDGPRIFLIDRPRLLQGRTRLRFYHYMRESYFSTL